MVRVSFIILLTYQLVWPSVSNIWKKAFGYGKVEYLPAGEYITNCSKCNCTCHHPCKIQDNARKWNCAAMNWKEAGERSVCQVCPRGCEWQNHCNNTFRIEEFEEHEEKTLDDLLKRYKTVRSDKNAVKTAVYKIQQRVKNLKKKVFEKICEAQQILARLDEIALKPNSLNELDYIDLLIESEKSSGKRLKCNCYSI